MKALTQHIIFSLLFIFFPAQLFAGNLSLIEKRLQELDQLNKQAVRQAGDIPKDGSVSIKAEVKPGGVLSKKAPETAEKQFVFDKREILSIDTHFIHSVQISSSRSKSQCYRVAALMRKAGYPAFTASIDLKDSGLWYRIFVGSYALKQEAEKMRQELIADEITDGFIRSMPYAVQVGDAAPASDLQSLREQVSALEYMPYTSLVRDTATSETKARLLVGAFSQKVQADFLLKELRQAGFQARIVGR